MAARAKKADETPPEGSKAPAVPAPGFEQRLEALEAIVRALEGEGLTLEQSLERYQQGVLHLTACRALLDGAEKRLLELVEGPDGGGRERALVVTDQGLKAASPGRASDPGADTRDDAAGR